MSEDFIIRLVFRCCECKLQRIVTCFDLSGTVYSHFPFDAGWKVTNGDRFKTSTLCRQCVEAQESKRQEAVAPRSS